MPHVNGDDLASSDEIKVFKDEGEDEKKLSENLTDDKSSLVTEGETEKTQIGIPGHGYSSSSNKNAHVSRSDPSPSAGKSFEPLPHGIGYVVSHTYPHPNGTLGPVSMLGNKFSHPWNNSERDKSAKEYWNRLQIQANKVSMVPQPHHPASPIPFMMYNSDAFAQPPPAHMGIPPVHIDPKTAGGIPLMAAHAAFQQFAWKEVLEHPGIARPPMYPLTPPGQYPHLFTSEFASQLQWPLLSRHNPSMYPMTSAGFRGSYPSTLPVSASGLPRFAPPTLIPPHPGLPAHPSFSHHAIITPGPKQEVPHHGQDNNRWGHNVSPVHRLAGLATTNDPLEFYRRHSAFNLDQKPLLKSNESSGGGGGGNSGNGSSSLTNHVGNSGNSGVGGAVSPPTNHHHNNNNNNNNNNNHHSSSEHHGTNHQNHHAHQHNHGNAGSGARPSSTSSSNSNHHHHHYEKKAPKNSNHIKKPLNAFMLYMKEMRAKVVAECTLKESAAINQILGRRWHSLSREEQAKYYEMARKERQLHMQLYPGWSARDNYAQSCKKKKRKKDKTHDGDGNNPKKCRARYGLDKQSSWCKPCRRKKKCIRYIEVGDHSQEENLGSVESAEAPTPDSKSTLDDDDDDSTSVGGGSDGELVHTSSELSLSSPPTVPSDIVDQKPLLSDSGAILRHQYQLHNLHQNSPMSAHLRNHHLNLSAATTTTPSPNLRTSSGSPLRVNHPLSVHHLSQSHTGISSRDNNNCEMDTNLTRMPTPPSTDSSTGAAPPMLTVT